VVDKQHGNIMPSPMLLGGECTTIFINHSTTVCDNRTDENRRHSYNTQAWSTTQHT